MQDRSQFSAALPFTKRMGNKTQAVPDNCHVVQIEAGEILFRYFRPVFQAGFLFRCQVGKSIADFLFRQLMLNKEFVEERISTVFLNGECVDDISLATLKDGYIMALSSALPGLVGATLRRGGFYACMRDSITYQKENIPAEIRQGTITVKLFNLLMEELGPVFLKKGIIMSRSALVNFFQSRNEDFRKVIKTVHLDGKSIAPDQLMDESAYDNNNHLIVFVKTIHQDQ